MIKDIQSQLLALNVNEYTDTKGNLTYLSWSHAWEEFIKVYPMATYKIKKNDLGLPYFGNEEHGYMVFTEVTVEDLTHEMWLPVMDYKNKSMLKPTTFDINKAIMRCLTKNLAMFGLGLYIYKGEDLPQVEQTELQKAKEQEEYEKERTLALDRCNKGITQMKLSDTWVKERFGSELLDMDLKQLQEVLIELKVTYNNAKKTK